MSTDPMAEIRASFFVECDELMESLQDALVILDEVHHAGDALSWGDAVREAFATATILRPSTVFGREDQFINRFAGMIARLPVVPVLRSGARFQPVYVGDVANAVVAGLSEPARFGGHTFELGGPEVLTMLEIQQRIASHIGRHPTFLPLPDAVGGLLASVPGGPLTGDQWKLLQRDSVVTAGEGLTAMGLARTPFDAVAPGWLVRYRKAGRFSLLSDAAKG